MLRILFRFSNPLKRLRISSFNLIRSTGRFGSLYKGNGIVFTLLRYFCWPETWLLITTVCRKPTVTGQYTNSIIFLPKLVKLKFLFPLQFILWFCCKLDDEMENIHSFVRENSIQDNVYSENVVQLRFERRDKVFKSPPKLGSGLWPVYLKWT